MSSAGLKAKNIVGSYTTIILAAIITLVVIAMATLLVLPNIAGTTPTATSTTSTSSSTTTSTTTTISPPTEFNGPTLINETSRLKLEVTLSGTSVNPNGYLGVRFNLTGAQEVNASYVELDVFNSQNQQVQGLAYMLGHSTQTPQPGPQGQIGTLYWQASTDPYFKVDVTPGIYTLIIGVTYENLTIKTSINVLGGTTSTVSTSPSSSSTTLQTVTVRLLLNKGLITIGDTTYSYMEWNDSTPNTFTFNNVTFTLQANTNVTYSGGNCYPTYGKYIVTFPDGSSQSLSTCLSAGPNPPSAIYFTSHKNPQAGLLISAVNGAVYFLVSI